MKVMDWRWMDSYSSSLVEFEERELAVDEMLGRMQIGQDYEPLPHGGRAY
jgi:hypothetical protein